MQNSGIPSKFPIPFANSATPADINPIPQGSQIGITPGAASLTDGFPPLCFLPVGAGGIAPWGRDFNGLFQQITQWTQWQNAGAGVSFDSSFSSNINGYPQGAILLSGGTAGQTYTSLVDNNITAPSGSSTLWAADTPTNFQIVAGNPNGQLAGLTSYSTVPPNLAYDTINSQIWYCTQSGGTGVVGAAVWRTFPSLVVGNPTLFVRTDGNDGNNGAVNTGSGAFKTISGALNAAASYLLLTGKTLTITLGLAGTYDSLVTISNIPSVTITSITPSSPASFIIGPVITSGACTVTINGVQLKSDQSHHTVQANNAGSITFTGSNIVNGTGTASIANFNAAAGGAITIGGTMTCSASSMGYCFSATNCGALFIATTATVTQSGTPNYSTATFYVTQSGNIQVFGSAVLSGAATGSKYSATTNGTIVANGQTAPGNSGGTTATGGQVVSLN